MTTEAESTPLPARDEGTPETNWFLAGVLLMAALLLAGREVRASSGLDTWAYIGAGIRILEGAPSMYSAGFTMDLPEGYDSGLGSGSREASFLPFLYHPAVGYAYAGLLRVCGGDFRSVVWVTNIAGVLLLSGGVALAWRRVLGSRDPVVLGGLLLLLWAGMAGKAGLMLGNLGLATAGLALLGAAGLGSGRGVVAGACLGLATLLKPMFGLTWLMLALLWQPEDDDGRWRKKVVLLGWLTTCAVATLAVAADTGRHEVGEWLALVERMGRTAWSISFMDGSVGAAVLRWASPYHPAYHAMLLWGHGNLEASTGVWNHKSIAVMQWAGRIALMAMIVAVVVRRRVLATEPVLVAGASFAIGFLAQPVNWLYNYGMLVVVPMALVVSGVPTNLGAVRREARAVAALVLLGLLWFPLAFYLREWGVFPPPTGPDAAVYAAHYGPARAVATIPVLALLGLLGLVLWGKGRTEPPHAPSPT